MARNALIHFLKHHEPGRTLSWQNSIETLLLIRDNPKYIPELAKSWRNAPRAVEWLNSPQFMRPPKTWPKPVLLEMPPKLLPMDFFHDLPDGWRGRGHAIANTEIHLIAAIAYGFPITEKEAEQAAEQVSLLHNNVAFLIYAYNLNTLFLPATKTSTFEGRFSIQRSPLDATRREIRAAYGPLCTDPSAFVALAMRGYGFRPEPHQRPLTGSNSHLETATTKDDYLTLPDFMNSDKGNK